MATVSTVMLVDGGAHRSTLLSGHTLYVQERAVVLCLVHGIAPPIEQIGDVTEPDAPTTAAYAALRPAHRRLYETVAEMAR